MRPHTSLGRKPDAWYFYYRCARQWHKGNDACPHKKMYRADAMERRVWEFVSDLLTDSERLRTDLDAKVWLEKLTQVDQERRSYQRLAAKGHMTDEELDEELAELAETRKIAERELEALRGRRERIEEMERDRDALLDNYARMAPEALNVLVPEERHQVYRILRLRAAIMMDGSVDVSGTFGEGDVFCPTATSSPRGRGTRQNLLSMGKLLWRHRGKQKQAI